MPMHKWQSLKQFTKSYLDTSEHLLIQGKQMKINDGRKLLSLKLHRDDHLWMRQELENYKQVISFTLYTKNSSDHLPYDRAELEKNESGSYKKVVHNEIELLFDRAINWQGIEVILTHESLGVYLNITDKVEALKVTYDREGLRFVTLSDQRFVVLEMGIKK